MARNAKPAAVATVAQPTVAHRLADAFDRSKDALASDVSRPLAESRTKQTAIVGGLLGIGAALHAALS